jgi:hypothetical protein
VPQAKQLPAPQARAHLDDEVIPVEGRTARKQPNSSGVKARRRTRPNTISGSTGRLGARVAGSATAMLLARLGHGVAVVDQASFPRGG